MKKQVLVLAMLFLLVTTTVSIAAVDPTVNANKSYLDQITKYGLVNAVPKDTDLNEILRSGVLYAQLIDLDAVAPKEMIIVRKEYLPDVENGESHNYYIEIWGYSNNKLVVLRQDFFDMEHYGLGYELSEATVNSKKYLVDSSFSTRGGEDANISVITESTTAFETLKNGKLTLYERYRSLEGTGQSEEVVYEKFFSKVGTGKETPVKKADYQKKLKQMFTTNKQIFRNSVNGNEILQPYSVTENTINELKKSLAPPVKANASVSSNFKDKVKTIDLTAKANRSEKQKILTYFDSFEDMYHGVMGYGMVSIFEPKTVAKSFLDNLSLEDRGFKFRYEDMGLKKIEVATLNAAIKKAYGIDLDLKKLLPLQVNAEYETYPIVKNNYALFQVLDGMGSRAHYINLNKCMLLPNDYVYIEFNEYWYNNPDPTALPEGTKLPNGLDYSAVPAKLRTALEDDGKAYAILKKSKTAPNGYQMTQLDKGTLTLSEIENVINKALKLQK